MWVTILLASKFTSPIVKATRWPSGEIRGSPTRRTFSKSLMVNWRLSCANATEASAIMKIKVDTTKRFIGILLELVSVMFLGKARSLLHQMIFRARGRWLSTDYTDSTGWVKLPRDL